MPEADEIDELDLGDTGERVFTCDDTFRSDSWPKPIAKILLLGSVLALAGWFIADRTPSAIHFFWWLVLTNIAIAIVVLWELRNPMIEIRVTSEAFTVIRQHSTKTYPWRELQAARFQTYPVANLSTSVGCFLFRIGGKNVELFTGLSDAQEQQFQEIAELLLQKYEIADEIPEMPSFEHLLGQAGAWVFIAGIFGLIAAHVVGYHTLGTIFGVAVILTGSVVAWLSRGQRISRFILAATTLLILSVTTILWACHINVRQVLNQWEIQEQKSGLSLAKSAK